MKETEAALYVRIGGGQFGSVYRVAEDINSYTFAVKVIYLYKYPNPEQARALAYREINALKRLKHVYISPDYPPLKPFGICPLCPTNISTARLVEEYYRVS